jgi:hypothetical protein
MEDVSGSPDPNTRGPLVQRKVQWIEKIETTLGVRSALRLSHRTDPTCHPTS